MAYVVEDLDALKEKWAEEQRRLRAFLILSDPPWLAERLTSGHLLIGGLDVSFSKLLPDVAVATLAVIELNTLQMAHHVSLSVRMTVPYVPTFLGYREVGPFEQLVSMVKSECPDRLPDVYMIDGNGTLHPRGFGCACQFGLQLGVSAMGVAKNLLETEEHHPDSGRLKSNEGSFLDQRVE